MQPIPERLQAALADRYHLEREVGQGGMATVYLAEDLKHHRKVALKVLRPELAAALGSERFVREVEIAAHLQHPHILPLFDSGEADGFLYYVMPFVDGESLRERLKRERAIPIVEGVRILREVVDALAYAHQHGVVHRDIKPDNVMLSGRHAVVTDFGVAKAVSAAGEDKLTTVGVALGTPTYMAPEQAMGETSLDQRADIYSVGALAYELFTGSPPFEKATAQALLSAHVLEKPVPPLARRMEMAPALSDLVMRCLEKEKDARYQTAEEMIPALEVLGTPSGGVTPTHTRPLPATKLHQRRSGTIIGVIAAVLVVLAMASWTLFRRGGTGTGKINQLAVLPIQDLSGKDQVFVDAMHDALISAIARKQVVGVVSRSAVMRFKGGSGTTEEIAKALHADAIIEATVFRDGERIRINVQMTEPVTLRYLWAQTYERDVKDVLDAQREIVDTIAAEVAAALKGQSPAPHAGALLDRPTGDLYVLLPAEKQQP
ncbi:MAG TPA: serine/threonine-protein kinase [Gemmatimonadales bacterium]|jgi:serine/threonine-protein kinase